MAKKITKKKYKEEPLERTVIEHRKLSFWNSVLNSLPVVFGLLIWGAISGIGTLYIQGMFYNNPIFPIVLMVWLIVMMQILPRLVPYVTTTYSVEVENVSKETVVEEWE